MDATRVGQTAAMAIVAVGLVAAVLAPVATVALLLFKRPSTEPRPVLPPPPPDLPTGGFPIVFGPGAASDDTREVT